MGEYNIAVYIRLSQADEETGKKKDESNSIIHQRMLLNNFLDHDAELCRCKRTEFADDGYSGTNTDRPSFQDMISGIRAGNYNLVVVKDFSRFSRDYIETGDYLECIFPFLGVRFISVNDGYDSKDYEGTTGGLDVVLKNIIYTAYSRDLSVKVKTAKKMHRKKGEYIESVPPLGYTRDPKDKHNLIIDEKGAKIVRCIFEMACDGVSINAIAKRLNEEGVITPAKYFAEKHPGTLQKYSSLGQRWSYASVHCILKRYSYTGALVTNKKATLAVGSNKHRLQDESEWIVIKGRFEPIISEEVFEQAQKILLKKRMVEKQTHDYPLRSLVRCGCCGRLMKRRTKGYGYECKYKKDDAKGECAGISYETENDLENVVFRAIRTQIEIYDVKTADRKALNEQKSKAVKETVAELSALEHQADHVREDKLRQYEEYVAGRISKEAYLKKKADGDTRLANIKEKIAENTSKLSNLERRVYASDEDDTVAHFRSQEKLTNEMAKAFIEAVYIHEKAAVEIKWRFADCFSETIKNDEMEVDIQ